VAESEHGKSFRELFVWQQAMDLAKDCYLLTNNFPRAETYGITSQIRRAATSVPANIAEGTGRGSRKDFQQFLRIAQGSLRELETYLLLAPQVDLAASKQTDPIIDKVQSVSTLLRKLIVSIEPKTD